MLAADSSTSASSAKLVPRIWGLMVFRARPST